MWGKDFNKYTTGIIEDLLDSVKRLNEELNSRVNFEQNLISVISAKDAEIIKLKDIINRKDREISDQVDEIEEMDEEIKKFVAFSSSHILKDGEQFVRNDEGEFEIYPERGSEYREYTEEE